MKRRSFTKMSLLLPAAGSGAAPAEVQTLKLELKLKEENLLSLEFNNTGKDPLILWSDAISWFWDSLRLRITTQDKARSWSCWAVGAFNVNRPRTVQIAPGAAQSLDIKMNKDWPSIALITFPTETLGFKARLTAVWEETSEDGEKFGVITGPITSNVIDAKVALNGIY